MSQVEPGSVSSSRLRILLVIKCLGFGGAERLLVDMVARGDTHSFEYEVAYVLAAEHALVPDIISHRHTGPWTGKRHGNGDLRWMGHLRRLIVDGRFDVVHFHLPYTAALGRLVVASLPAARRPAVVYTEHSLSNKMAVLDQRAHRATIGRDQALVVVSEAAHDALPHRLKERARVIVHGVDLSRSDALIADRDAVRAEVRAELGVDS